MLVATEEGLIHRLRKDNPGKTFHRVSPFAVCPNMKRITLAKILDCLVNMHEEVVIDPATAARARASVERMIALKL